MTISAAVLSSILIAGASPAAETFVARAQTALLDGQAMPSDFEMTLATLSPVDRFAIVIWLRRSGLLAGPEIPLDEMLAPIDAKTQSTR